MTILETFRVVVNAIAQGKFQPRRPIECKLHKNVCPRVRLPLCVCVCVCVGSAGSPLVRRRGARPDRIAGGKLAALAAQSVVWNENLLGRCS